MRLLQPPQTSIFTQTLHTWRAQPVIKESVSLSSCLLLFYFAAPLAPFMPIHTLSPPPHVHKHIHKLMHTLLVMAEPVLNRGLQAFHFCSKSIGLCRTQHLIEVHKLTDYWIVTYCIGGCLWSCFNCFTKVNNGQSTQAQLFYCFFTVICVLTTRFIHTLENCVIWYFFSIFFSILMLKKMQNKVISNFNSDC